jgi:CBS domain-containing protein/nucleotide-binding universal stress UspA family protein
MKVLIAFDGSNSAWAALDKANRALPLERATVFIIAVGLLLPPSIGMLAGGRSHERYGASMSDSFGEEEAHAQLAKAVAGLKRLGVEAEAIFRCGDAAIEILAAAETLEIDVIVMGSNGRRPVGRFLHGSVSQAVVRRFRGMTLVVGPGRQLGTTATLNVEDAMTAVPLKAQPTDTVQEVARLMSNADTGFIPLVKNGELVGVVTDRDIAVRAVAAGLDPVVLTSYSICSKPPVVVETGTAIEHAIALMESHKIRRLPVMDGGKLVGVVTLGDLAELLPAAAEEVLVEISKSPKTLAHRPRT